MGSNFHQHFDSINLAVPALSCYIFLVTPDNYNQFFISTVFGSFKVNLYQNLGDSFFKIVVYTSDQSPGKLPVKQFVF